MQDSAADLFPLFYKTTWNKNQDISSINDWVRTATKRWKGFHTMELVLSRCSEDVILKHGISWIELAMVTVVKNHIEDSIRIAAAQNFTKLLEMSSQIPSVSRELSSNNIVNILQQILSSDTCNPIPCLTCLDAVMDHFPSPCSSHKGKISKFLFPHAMSLNSNIQHIAIRCWSKVSLLGGGGVGRKNHAQQWEQQFQETLEAWAYVTSCLWESRLEDGDADPSIASLSFHFEPLPYNEPNLTFSLLQRFVMICKCICQMLALNFPLLVAVSVDAIFNILVTNFDITPKALKVMESKMYVDCLQAVHTNCLHVLKACMESGHSQLCRRANQINHMFLNLLTMWKDPAPVCGLTKENNAIRLEVYQTMLHWVQCCGTKSQLLIGEKHFVEPLLQHFVLDFASINDNEKVKADPIIEKLNGNKKRSKRHVNSTEISFSRISDSSANSQLCQTSLQVLRNLIFSNGSQLPVFIHKELQQKVVVLLMELVQGKNLIPFTKCAGCRKELYHLLLALTVVPCPQYPAPLQLAVTIISHGCLRDSNKLVRSFCMEASAVLANIVRPRVPALNRICPSFDWRPTPHEPSQNGSENCQVMEESSKELSPGPQENHHPDDPDSTGATNMTEQKDKEARRTVDKESNFDKNPSEESLLTLKVMGNAEDATALPECKNITSDRTASNLRDDSKVPAESTVISPVSEDVCNNEVTSSDTVDHLTRGTKRKLVDKPIGTSESKSAPDGDHNEEELGDDVTAMLEDFVDASPDDDDGDTLTGGSGDHDLV